jgi:hypothetical protein
VESSQSEKSTRERVSSDLQKALEDLRRAGENATGDVRSGIESAVTRIRDASGSASSGDLRGDLRGQLDSFRSWLQSATVDILDDIEQEVRKRREQLAGQGGTKSGPSSKSGSSSRSRSSRKSGSSSKSSGAKSRSGSSGSRSGGSS